MHVMHLEMRLHTNFHALHIFNAEVEKHLYVAIVFQSSDKLNQN